MNEIIIVGEVLPKIVKRNNNSILEICMKVNNDVEIDNYNYVPISFRNIDLRIIKSLLGKQIGISGHIEVRQNIKIFADVVQVIS